MRQDAKLFLIVLMAFSFRVATWRYPYFPEVDPYHHYRVAEHLAMTGEIPTTWPLSLAPTGAAITEPHWLYYPAVGLYWLFRPFGLSFLRAFKLAPALAGALSVVPLYLIARRVFDTEVAIYASLITAVLPAAIYRSSAGFYRGDVFAVLIGLWGVWLVLQAIGRANRLPIALPIALIAGLAIPAVSAIHLWRGDHPILGWVNEMAAPSPLALLLKFGPLLMLMPKGVYHTLQGSKGREIERTLFLGWLGASVILLGVAIRFSYLAAYPLAVLGGVGIAKCPRRPMVVVALLSVVLWGGYYVAVQQPLMGEDWREALEFLGQQERGIVLTWWDTGSWVQGVTSFPTVVDSVAGQKREQVEAVANAFLSVNASNVSGFLQQHGVMYIVVSVDMAEHPGAVQSAAYQPEGALGTNSFLRALAYQEGQGFPVRRIWGQGGVAVYQTLR